VFSGTIMPLASSQAGTTTFLDPRHALHTRYAEIVSPGTVIFDEMGRVFLVAQHETQQGLYKVSRLFELTRQVAWGRMTESTEPLTGLARNLVETSMGNIWVATDIYGREEVDRGLHMAMDRVRIITGSAIALDDRVDGRIVRRLNTVYGVSVAEIQ
jgi:hypothetical protein